jgi:signal transduction histidine kinase/CheY-like chemotaxis protein
MPSTDTKGRSDHDAAPKQNGGSSSGFDARPIILTLGILIIALICIGVTLVIYELRQRDLNEERRTLTAIDFLLVQETEHTLQSVDLILVNVAEKLAADGVTTAAELAETQAGRSTYEMLKSRLIGIPQLDALSLVSDEGKIVNFSRSFPAPDIDVADRDFFQVQRAAPRNQLFVSQPFQSRATGRWSVYLARRINGPSGKFLGLVLGVIDLTYFENLYKTLQLGTGGSVSLWRSDGTLLVGYPNRSDIGQISPFRTNPLAEATQFEHPITYEIDDSTDGPARIVATMAAQQFPIVVNISKNTGEILTDWNQVAALMAGGTFLCIVALGVVLWLLMHQFNAYEALTEAHEERSKAIADREQAEAQLRQAQKLEAIGQLTGGIAHDFNNLLTAVLGNLELLKKQTETSDERLHRWASNAYDAANRGAVLTQRLLVFSRRQPLDPRATDVVTLLASMSDLLSHTLGENITIVTEIAPELWPAYADLNQLDNAILNIAINARDAMDGRGHLIIAASNCQIDDQYAGANLEIEPGQYVKLAITDTGQGIEQAVLERVFEPFFSTKPIGQGTGLGLSQVYGFIKQTGGHVQIHSEPGHGTTVELYLPRAAQDDLALPVSEPVEEAVRASGMGSILVVEDDPDVRAYSGEILRELGFLVREAPNARAALDMLRNDTGIELLFSDIGLPGMTGPELAREALQLRSDLKILLTTGYAQDKTIDRARSEPGVLLITKPFGRAELAQKIRALLLVSSQQCA